MQRLWLNLALAVIVAALGVTLVLSKHHQDKEKNHPPLTALQADAIHQITLNRPGEKPLSLLRQGTQWRITSPIAVDADAIEVRGLLDVASTPSEETIPRNDVKLAALGLQPPRFTLTLDSTRFDFGTTEPLRYRRYVQVGGTIHLIADPASQVFSGNWANLVSKSLLPAGASIRSVQVPGWTVSRSSDGKSWSATPPAAAQSAASVSAFTGAWSGARAMWNTLTPAGAASAGDPVEVTLSDGRVLNFRVTQRDPQFNLERPDLGITYVLSREDENRLLHLPSKPPAASSAGAGGAAAPH
jgi:hypothetical protein